MGIGVRLAETLVTAPTVDTSSYVEDIRTMLGSVFTVDNLVTIIVAMLGLCLGFVIFWFAYRFILRKVNKAMRKGSI